MMKRVLRWVLRLIGAAGVITAAWLLVQWLWLPSFVTQRLTDALHEANLPAARVRVVSVGLHRMILRDLSVGTDQPLTVDLIAADYQPSGLRDGRVKSIMLIGADLHAAYADGRIDLGPLMRVKLGSGGDGAALPFDQLTIRDSSVTIHTGDHDYRIGLDGMVKQTSPGTLDADLTLHWLDQHVHITGAIAMAGGQFDASDLRLQIGPTTMTPPGTSLTLIDAKADVHVSAKVGANHATFELLPRTSLHIGSLRETNQTIAIDPGHVAGHASLTWSDTQAATWRADVTLDGATLGLPAMGLHVEQVHLALPIRPAGAADEGGKLTTGPIHIGDLTLPAITGAARIIGARCNLTADWPLLDVAHLQIAGYAEPGAINIAAHTGTFTLLDSQAIGRLLPAMAGVEITGKLAVNAALTLHDGIIQPIATLTLDGADVHSKAYDLSVSGIHGAVTLDRFHPLHSPGEQSLSIDHIQSGKLALSDGQLAFRIESDHRVFVERAAMTLGQSGRLTAHAFECDFDKPIISTQLYVEKLDLGDWLSVLSDHKITATGQLYGRIPIKFNPQANWKLTLGEGFLYAGPGGGELKMSNVQLAGQLLDQADPRFASDPALAPARTKIIDALTDFAYSMFRFDLQPEGEGMMLRIETRGKGRTGQKPVEIGSLVVNVHHFDTLVNQALRTQTRLKIDQALNQFFQGGDK